LSFGVALTDRLTGGGASAAFGQRVVGSLADNGCRYVEQKEYDWNQQYQTGGSLNDAASSNSLL